ncbi:MAG: hypothetical protein NVSMB12_02040 [Acidimicrobiales bacterium]
MRARYGPNEPWSDNARSLTVSCVEEVEVLQGLRVLTCDGDGRDLVVSLYGGPTFACGAVRWLSGNSRARLRQLRRWRDAGTAVTYVRRGATVTLVDEDALLRDALRDGRPSPEIDTIPY